MTMKSRLLVFATAMAGCTAASATDAGSSPAAPQVKAVIACRSLAEGTARLACYDRAATELDRAIDRKEVVVVDKATMREARRGIFGFSLPSIKLFQSGKSDAEDVQSIDAKLAGVGTNANGGLLLTLDTGARWQQVDDEYVNRPRAGQTVTIRKATISGYMAKIEGGRGFRVRRLAE